MLVKNIVKPDTKSHTQVILEYFRLTFDNNLSPFKGCGNKLKRESCLFNLTADWLNSQTPLNRGMLRGAEENVPISEEPLSLRYHYNNGGFLKQRSHNITKYIFDII